MRHQVKMRSLWIIRAAECPCSWTMEGKGLVLSVLCLLRSSQRLNLSRWVKVSVPHDTDGCKNLKCILSATRMSVHTDVHSSHDCNSDGEEENPQLCLWLCELISVQILSCAHSHFESAQLHSGYPLDSPSLCTYTEGLSLKFLADLPEMGQAYSSPFLKPGIWDKPYSDNADTLTTTNVK